ncbi:MAG: hypothetical protein DME16_00975 [Candidatus Rokuibacteriota bacterium]|nr:MAG: hypothetical protein DME16_00975 [Candidatus Rokubacteria bacterium]
MSGSGGSSAGRATTDCTRIAASFPTYRRNATARIVGVTYRGLQTEVTAEIVGGRRLLAFVPEPAPPGLVPGRTLLLHLPAGAFMSLTPRAATASGPRS